MEVSNRHGTAHPGPDLHQTTVEDQSETVLSANDGTDAMVVEVAPSNGLVLCATVPSFSNRSYC